MRGCGNRALGLLQGRDAAVQARPCKATFGTTNLWNICERTWQASIQRVCRALQTERSSYHYKSKRTGPVALKTRIKEIAETRVRYGYQRITVLLKREGRGNSVGVR